MYFASALTWGAVQDDQDVLVPHELRIPTVYCHALIGSINNLGTDLKVIVQALEAAAVLSNRVSSAGWKIVRVIRLKRSGVKPASVFAKNDRATGLLLLRSPTHTFTSRCTGVLKMTKRYNKNLERVWDSRTENGHKGSKRSMSV